MKAIDKTAAMLKASIFSTTFWYVPETGKWHYQGSKRGYNNQDDCLSDMLGVFGGLFSEPNPVEDYEDTVHCKIWMWANGLECFVYYPPTGYDLTPTNLKFFYADGKLFRVSTDKGDTWWTED